MPLCVFKHIIIFMHEVSHTPGFFFEHKSYKFQSL